jgi:hypothetical protein
MTVNGFSHEDEVRAAYDAAERCLYHSVDVGEITINTFSTLQKETLEKLAVRIVDAVMHSSERDISDILPSVVQRVQVK